MIRKTKNEGRLIPGQPSIFRCLVRDLKQECKVGYHSVLVDISFIIRFINSLL